MFEALGAFLSGAASILTATWYVRRMSKRAEQQCDRRIDAFREGVKLGQHEQTPGNTDS